MKKAVKILLVVAALAAYCIFAYTVFQPWIHRSASRKEASKAASEFMMSYAVTESGTAPTEDLPEDPAEPMTEDPHEDLPEEQQPYAELLAAMQEYNGKIYREAQSGLCDPWSYQQTAIDLSAYGIEDDAIGVIEIPGIFVSLPIYSGASTANLNKGAALLAQTSFPIGGDNTNSVIAAHRGWNAEDYLRDIEDVRLGDEVRIINYWGVLRYVVTEIHVIAADEIDKILIRPGQDLLTVFTCHPYGSSLYRYLLICTRAEEPSEDLTDISTAETWTYPLTEDIAETEALPDVTVSSGVTYRSARAEVQAVSVLPWIGIGITALLIAAGIWRLVCCLKTKKTQGG